MFDMESFFPNAPPPRLATIQNANFKNMLQYLYYERRIMCKYSYISL